MDGHLTRTKWIRFDQIPPEARGRPGLYEIRYGRCMLKVGIAGNLLSRLKQHSDSLQRRLKGSSSDPWTNPDDVTSKGSILAKHLYFDQSIAPKYDLRTEAGRQQFLARCRVRLEFLETRDIARQRERVLEGSGNYRYCGRVQIR